MADHLKAAVFELSVQSYQLAACCAQRKQLRSMGDPGAADDLSDLLRRTIDRILQLQAEVQKASEDEGDSQFSSSIGNLIMGLRRVIEEADVAQLSDIARQYGLTHSDELAEVVRICRLGAAVNDPTPEFQDALGGLLFLVAVSTLASVGAAPVVAALSHQALGSTVLESAVSTFLSVGLSESAIQYHRFHQRVAAQLRERGIRAQGELASLGVPQTESGCFQMIDKLRQERRSRQLDRNMQELLAPSAADLTPSTPSLGYPSGPSLSGPSM